MEPIWRQISPTHAIAVDGTVLNTKLQRTLRGSLSPTGRDLVNIAVGRSSRIVSVSRLVAEAFLPAPTRRHCILEHIDGDKNNHHAANLRWVYHEKTLPKPRRKSDPKPKPVAPPIVSVAMGNYKVEFN